MPELHQQGHHRHFSALLCYSCTLLRARGRRDPRSCCVPGTLHPPALTVGLSVSHPNPCAVAYPCYPDYHADIVCFKISLGIPFRSVLEDADCHRSTIVAAHSSVVCGLSPRLSRWRRRHLHENPQRRDQCQLRTLNSPAAGRRTLHTIRKSMSSQMHRLACEKAAQMHMARLTAHPRPAVPKTTLDRSPRAQRINLR